MKSLQQYISEQMVCELSSTKLAQAYRKETDRNGHETNRARKFKKGAHQALDRELSTTYEIGDLYYDGNKAVGIVVDTKYGSEHATVMSLTSFDKNGNHKTSEQEISWEDAINGAKQYGKGWYLPSKEGWETMYKSFDKIQSVLKNTKGALALDDSYYYWSSTKYGSYGAYTVGSDFGGVDKYDNVCYVRAFLSV